MKKKNWLCDFGIVLSLSLSEAPDPNSDLTTLRTQEIITVDDKFNDYSWILINFRLRERVCFVQFTTCPLRFTLRRGGGGET